MELTPEEWIRKAELLLDHPTVTLAEMSMANYYMMRALYTRIDALARSFGQ